MPSSVQTVLKSAVNCLRGCTDTPLLDAQVLLAFVLNCARTALIAWPEKALSETEVVAYEQLLARRAAGEPLAYLLGRKEFWSMNLRVSPDVLIPRPDTETLIEAVLAAYPSRTDILRIADLGTGSGAIALALARERPAWEVHATDLSEKALHIASQNAQEFGCVHIAFHQGNWCNALPSQRFDVLVSNPPYLSLAEWPLYEPGLRFEPKNALVAAEEGLADIRCLITNAKAYLKPGARFFIEHGYAQAKTVTACFQQAGYDTVETFNDVAGLPRVTVGRISC